MKLPHLSDSSSALLRGVAAATLVVGAGLVLGATGTIGPAAAGLLAAKVGTAIAARYAAKQLVDVAPDGAAATHSRFVPVACGTPQLRFAEVAYDPVVLAALGDSGPSIQFG